MCLKPWLERRIIISLHETQVQELRFEDESEYKNLIPEITFHQHLSPSQPSINPMSEFTAAVHEI